MDDNNHLLKQIEERIDAIEKYPNADHFLKKDYLIVICVVLICLILVIFGAYL